MGYAPGIETESLERAMRRARPKRKRRRLERTLEDRAVDHAKKLGHFSRKMNGLGYRSWPDRYFTDRPRPLDVQRPALWVEFKRAGEDPTPQQRHVHKELRARGERVAVVDTWKKFEAVFHDHFD